MAFASSATTQLKGAQPLIIRSLPYPYRSGLALSSDLDGTRSAVEYFGLIDFINRPDTAERPGLGLEFANSIYFAMPQKQFSYFGASEEERARLRAYVSSGLIDTVHSFGGRARTRVAVDQVLREIETRELIFPVWTNHGRVPTNFRELRGKRTGKGDIRNSDVYHAQKSRRLGMTYVWRSQVTAVIGQNASADIWSLWRKDHARPSAITCLRQFSKSKLGTFNAAWSLHPRNRLFDIASLEDGTEVVEFIRSNPHWAGIGTGEAAAELSEVLSPQVLSTLVRSGGISIIYTHLGKRVSGQDSPLPDSAIRALKNVASFQKQGKMLIVTTSRALDISCLSRFARAVRETRGTDKYCIDIQVDAPAFLQDRLSEFLPRSGLTVYFEGPPPVEVTANTRSVLPFTVNPADETGRLSISLPFSRPEIPD